MTHIRSAYVSCLRVSHIFINRKMTKPNRRFSVFDVQKFSARACALFPAPIDILANWPFFTYFCRNLLIFSHLRLSYMAPSFSYVAYFVLDCYVFYILAPMVGHTVCLTSFSCAFTKTWKKRVSNKPTKKDKTKQKMYQIILKVGKLFNTWNAVWSLTGVSARARAGRDAVLWLQCKSFVRHNSHRP